MSDPHDPSEPPPPRTTAAGAAAARRRGSAPATRQGAIPAGPAPDARRLRDAALHHLARFSSTEAGLVQVLDRRIRRWSLRAAAEGAEPEAVAERVREANAAARTVAGSLVAAGAIDDAAYAEARARALTRAGRSRRAARAHLAEHGVPADLAATVLPEDRDAELAAALVQARRRRIGPFAPEAPEEASGDADADAGPDPDAPAPRTDPMARRNRMLSALARAGFARDVAERALDLDRETAETLILALKRA